MHFDLGGCGNSAEISLLLVGLVRLCRADMKFRGEITNAVHLKLGQGQFAEGLKVEPLVWRPLQAAIEQIEAVDINIGFQ